MIEIKRKLKNFGPLEALVLSSLTYVAIMLIWTASTRSAVVQKANDIKANHKLVVEFINNQVNECSTNENGKTSWGDNCNSTWISSKIVKYILPKKIREKIKGLMKYSLQNWIAVESKNNKITFENRKILSNVYLEDVKLLRETFKYDFSEWEDFKL